MSRSSKGRRNLIEEIIGKDVITHIVKNYTMSNFINNRILPLYEGKLTPTEIEAEYTEYMKTLVKEFNRRYIREIIQRATNSGIIDEVEKLSRSYIKRLTPEEVDAEYIRAVVNELNRGYIRTTRTTDSKIYTIDEIESAIQILPFTERDIERIELRKRLPENIKEYVEFRLSKYEELEKEHGEEENSEESND